ncbi:MarR family winged helix-turn-helix transcriptional regulator [Marinactinospora thermotolerans]|uniref:DNA-binding transcriptional regulator, MarR family n=1 Tax=Marinactinospora thermotolerans DSM 45154 TaxID=1122192 RepID=A0A1T4NBP6_9ACTN|nr:MarR family transcriptional regulator [Marinactinospora thermotolerans]SJZ76699.1 DNA-binding transcriptional regulator, MarR family [Marinactinospora thermotolerans DSM 45154]
MRSSEQALAGDREATSGEAVVSLLARVTRVAVRELDAELRPHNLRSRDVGVLTLIESAGPRSQQDIGRELGIDRTSMVGIIDHLTGLGLVERVRDPHDRRRYAVSLTAEGERLQREVLRPLGAGVDARLLAGLDSAQRTVLRQTLELLARGDDHGNGQT